MITYVPVQTEVCDSAGVNENSEQVFGRSVEYLNFQVRVFHEAVCVARIYKTQVTVRKRWKPMQISPPIADTCQLKTAMSVSGDVGH